MKRYSFGSILSAFAVTLFVSCQSDSKQTNSSVNDTAISQPLQPSTADTGNLKTGKNMEQVISKDGTKIAFEKKGVGPALIIVSGALSERSLFDNQAQSLIDSLSKHFTVYIYDRRGRGESTDVQPYAVDREIEDIEALINNAGGTAYLYGVSSGGALALQAAAKLGATKVQKLAVYEIPYGQGMQAFDRQKQGVSERVKNGQPGDAAIFFLTEIGTPAEALEGMKSSPQWATFKKIDFTLNYDYQVLGDGIIPQQVTRNISIPILVMAGEKGMPFIKTTAEQLGKQLSNARHQVLKGQAHQAEAGVVAPVLIDFFGK
jgi:pimeloyl-ACP methyl ester carboxylesterase